MSDSCLGNIYTIINTAKNKQIWQAFLKDYINNNYSDEMNLLVKSFSEKFNDIDITIDPEQIKRNIIFFMVSDSFDSDVSELILMSKAESSKLVTNLTEIERDIKKFYYELISSDQLRSQLCEKIGSVQSIQSNVNDQKRYTATKNLQVIFDNFDNLEMVPILKRAYDLLNSTNGVRILNALSHHIPITNLMNKLSNNKNIEPDTLYQNYMYFFPIILVRMPDTSVKLIYKLSESERKIYREDIYNALGETSIISQMETEQIEMIRKFNEIKSTFDETEHQFHYRIEEDLKNFKSYIKFSDDEVRTVLQRDIPLLTKPSVPSELSSIPRREKVQPPPPSLLPSPPPPPPRIIQDFDEIIKKRDQQIKNILEKIYNEKSDARIKQNVDKSRDVKELFSEVVLDELVTVMENKLAIKVNPIFAIDSVIDEYIQEVKLMLNKFTAVDSRINYAIDNFVSDTRKTYYSFKESFQHAYTSFNNEQELFNREKTDIKIKYLENKKKRKQFNQYIDPYNLDKLSALDKQIIESKKKNIEFIILEILLLTLSPQSAQNDQSIDVNKYRLHSNIILINLKKETIEHFEPHGSLVAYYNAHKVYHALKEFIKDIKSIKLYKFVHAVNQTITFEGLGPQALSRDSYCLAWSYYFTFTRIINPEKSFEEIEAIVKSVINPSFLYKDVDCRTPLLEQLENKYIPLSTCDIRKRIERFILWTRDLCDFMDDNKVSDHISLEKYLSFTTKPFAKLKQNIIMGGYNSDRSNDHTAKKYKFKTLY